MGGGKVRFGVRSPARTRGLSQRNRFCRRRYPPKGKMREAGTGIGGGRSQCSDTPEHPAYEWTCRQGVRRDDERPHPRLRCTATPFTKNGKFRLHTCCERVRTSGPWIAVRRAISLWARPRAQYKKGEREEEICAARSMADRMRASTPRRSSSYLRQ
eukprot:scaffold88396_cov33-Tisochrysis_lutea.AAC.3